MTTEQLMRDAAVARQAGVATRMDRPRQRRWAEEPTAPARVGARLRDLSLRASAAGDTVAFLGVATAYEAPYEMYDFWGPYTEVVSAGAGEQSLNRADLDVPLVLQHADLRRIARTTNGSLALTETDDGLQVDAPALDMADQDVAYIVPKLRSLLIDEMSFKFMITAGQWSPDYTEFRIQSYDIHRGDVAIVGYGANPATSAGLRGQDMRQLARDLPDEAARTLAGLLTQRFLTGPTAEPARAASRMSTNQAQLLLDRS